MNIYTRLYAKWTRPSTPTLNRLDNTLVMTDYFISSMTESGFFSVYFIVYVTSTNVYEKIEKRERVIGHCSLCIVLYILVFTIIAITSTATIQ